MRNKILIISLFLYLWPVFKNEANAQQTPEVSNGTRTVKHRTTNGGDDYLKNLKGKVVCRQLWWWVCDDLHRYENR